MHKREREREREREDIGLHWIGWLFFLVELPYSLERKSPMPNMLKHLRQPITYYTFSLSPMVDQKTCGGISLYFLSKMIMLRLSNVRFSFIHNQRKHGLKCNVCHFLCTHFVTKRFYVVNILQQRSFYW